MFERSLAETLRLLDYDADGIEYFHTELPGKTTYYVGRLRGIDGKEHSFRYTAEKLLVALNVAGVIRPAAVVLKEKSEAGRQTSPMIDPVTGERSIFDDVDEPI